MKNVDAPRRLDLRRFAEDGGTLAGNEPLGAYPRLAAEAQGDAASLAVRWLARGELRNPRHVEPEVWLHLQASTSLPLTCQRCLGPVQTELAVQRSFRFVSDEADAAAQDDQADEDVLALSRAFDLPELVEDELLMALPLVPRHDNCPAPVKMEAVDADFDAAQAGVESPFAALQRLKPGNTGKP